jgi:integrase
MLAAKAAGLINESPCRVPSGGRVKRPKAMEMPDAAGLALLAEYLPTEHRTMFWTACLTGLRFGELTELRRGDLDLAAGVLRVRRGVVAVKAGRGVDAPKTWAGVRTVELPMQLVALLAAHLEKIGGRDDALVFPGPAGGHLAASTLRWHWDKARKVAGYPALRWHGLRHVAGTLAAMAGANEAESTARQGPDDMAMARLYVHAAKGRDREIADGIGALVADVMPTR